MGICTLVGMWVLDGEFLQFVGNLVLNSGNGPWGMHGDRYLGGNVGFRWELLQFVGNLALNSGRGPWGMHGDMYLGGNVGFRWGIFAICGEPCTQQWKGTLGNA